MADLTLGGQDIRQAAARSSGSGIFLDLVSGYFEPADVRGADEPIPSSPGRLVLSRVKDSRTIVLRGYVRGTTPSDWHDKTETLFAALDPLTPADLVIGDGYLGSTGSPTISVRFLNAVGEPPVKGPTFQAWTITLWSVAPDWS